MINAEELKAFENIMAYVEKYPDEFKECQQDIQILNDYVKGLYSTGNIKPKEDL
jgi:hypothetical protein